MDQGRAFAALLSLLAIGASPDRAPLPREARWTDPPARQDVLALEPPECLRLPKDRAERARVLLGRVAFSTPLLLGGQAARAGLSCASCHRSGRGNLDFRFPGMTGDAGTADVTSSVFSKVRGDGVFNPRPIPDLAMDPPKISRVPASSGELRGFIRGLVMEEFDGTEPPPAVMDGLVSYVQALGSDQCAAQPGQARSAVRDAGEAILAIEAALERIEARDPASARMMLHGARAVLGRIDERYPASRKARTALASLDRDLQAGQRAIDAGREADIILVRAKVKLGKAMELLERDAPSSLYEPSQIKALLGNQP